MLGRRGPHSMFTEAHSTEPYPMMLAVALARGGSVRVPVDMKPVCEQLQKVYTRVIEAGADPTSELALVVRLLVSGCDIRFHVRGPNAVSHLCIVSHASQDLFYFCMWVSV